MGGAAIHGSDKKDHMEKSSLVDVIRWSSNCCERGSRHKRCGRRGGSNRRVRSVDLQIKTEKESEFPVPDFLKEIVDKLKALKDCKVELLTESCEDGWTIPISVSIDEEGEMDLNLFVAIGQNQVRERRVAAFSVIDDKTNIVLVTTESDPVYLRSYSRGGDSESNLQDTLQRAAEDFLSRDKPFQVEAMSATILRVLEQ